MRERLHIERTDVSPEIIFDMEKMIFSISGRSMPENSEGFYEPVLNWIRDNFKDSDAEAVFDINLDYYNTGSFIRLMGLFNLLGDMNAEGKKFSVRWICEAEDEDNIADGESFKEVVKVPFHIIEI